MMIIVPASARLTRSAASCDRPPHVDINSSAARHFQRHVCEPVMVARLAKTPVPSQSPP
ncbi:hypothetical protein C8Q73DRAFT_683068 [Cubamyces lactineus]|nr:hypothetical protein C8Q73DRAFT_683068 [Cubamyces lactineus]